MTKPVGSALSRPAPRRYSRAISLTVVLARKNLRVKYRRATLGVVWVVVPPVLQSAVVATVFGIVAPSLAVPYYPVFVLAGVLPWSMTSRAISGMTMSVVENAGLVRKVALPRIVFPLSVLGGFAAVFGISIVILVLSGAVAGTLTVTSALALPAALTLHLALTAAVGVLTSAVYVYWRDVSFIVESAMMVLFYASPVIYPAERLGQVGERVLAWNPVTGMLSLYRYAVMGRPFEATAAAVTVVFTLAVGVSALLVFRRLEPNFADLV